MSAEDDAYELAQRRIAEAKASGATLLDLGGAGSILGGQFPDGDNRLRSLKTLPPEIADLTALETLSLDRTQVADLTPLAAMTGIQGLNLNSTQVADLTPLAAMTGMQTLNLSHTQVADLTPLAAMTAMQRLDLNGTKVADLTPLAAMTAMQRLFLDGTQVADLTPLAAMTELALLFFKDIPACAAEPELQALSEIGDAEERARKTVAWLRARSPRPPDPAPDRRDFFISYTSVDQAHALAINAALRAAGFKTFLHAQDVNPGGNFVRWMNQSLDASRRVLALASPAYFDDAAPWSEQERTATLAMDPTGDEARLVLVELSPCRYSPLYRPLSKITETSGLGPEDAAQVLVARLKSAGSRGRAAAWDVGADQVSMRAGLPDDLEDFTEALSVAQLAAATLADALTAEGIPDHPLIRVVGALRAHLDRPPEKMKADRVLALHVMLLDAVAQQKRFALQRHNMMLSEYAAGPLDSLALATRHLLRELPGGVDAEAAETNRDGGDPLRAEAVFNTIASSAVADDDSVDVVRIFISLFHQGGDAGAAAACHATDLMHNFQVALGNAVNELRSTLGKTDREALQRHYAVRFIRQNRDVLADFAYHNVARGRAWWGIIDDLVNPDRWS